MRETLESPTSALLLPQSLRGLGFGVLATVNGLGDLLSSLLVGVLWSISPTLSMGLVIATSLTGAAIIASTDAERQGDGLRLGTAAIAKVRADQYGFRLNADRCGHWLRRFPAIAAMRATTRSGCSKVA